MKLNMLKLRSLLSFFWQTPFSKRVCSRGNVISVTVSLPHRQLWGESSYYYSTVVVITSQWSAFASTAQMIGKFKLSQNCSSSTLVTTFEFQSHRFRSHEFQFLGRSFSHFILTRTRSFQSNQHTKTSETLHKTTKKKKKEKTNWLQLWIFISAPGTNLLRFTIRKIVN